MGQISREGTFRGVATDSGVGLTTNGFPQFVAQISALEFYDFDEKVWVDWSGQNEEISGYFCLFGGNSKPTLSAKQVQKALGWSGQSFSELNDANYEATPFQFRVEEHEYDGNTTLQVSWIDAFDATPGRQVQKLDAADAKKLDKLFAAQLKNFGGTKVVSAPATTGKPVVPKATNIAQADQVDTEPEAEQSEPEMPKTKTKAKKGTVEVLPEGTCTKTDAWRETIGLIEDLHPEMSDEERASLFTDAIQEVAPKAKKKADVTPEQWFVIKEVCEKKVVGF